MNVYQKLNEARKRFHAQKLKKSGRNTFANYDYFELGDFLIPAMQVFEEVGLCGLVSFPEGVATMRVVNVEAPEEVIVFEAPMGSAALKGCHEVQNLGAVETYQRRYMWVKALEIVEHDALEATTGKPGAEPEGKATHKKGNERTPTTAQRLATELTQSILADLQLTVVEKYESIMNDTNPDLVDQVWARLTADEQDYIRNALNEAQKRK